MYKFLKFCEFGMISQLVSKIQISKKMTDCESIQYIIATKEK